MSKLSAEKNNQTYRALNEFLNASKNNFEQAGNELRQAQLKLRRVKTYVAL